jgi:hypothetical protein
VGPGAGLDRCGKSRPTGIRSPDLPVRSESLYRLRYPGSGILALFIYITRLASNEKFSPSNKIHRKVGLRTYQHPGM